MRLIILHFLGILSVTLAVSFGPAFNKAAIPHYLDSSNSYGVLPGAIVQQPAFPLANSFNLPQDQKAWSVLPQRFENDQANGAINSNLYGVLPTTIVQQPASPQVGSLIPPQDQQTWSESPRKYRAYLVNAVIDSNPDAVPPAAIVQQPDFSLVGSSISPQYQQAWSVLPQKFSPGQATPGIDNNDGKGHFTDVVRTFATNFLQRIQASPVYRDAFSLHKVSREDATRLFKDYVYVLIKENGDRDSEFSSHTVFQAVNKNYESTTNLRFREVHAYTVGELLYQTGLLNEDNALRLSDEYFRDTADAIDAANDDSPVEKLRAAMTGFRNFLTHNLLTKYKNLTFAVSSVFVQVYYALK